MRTGASGLLHSATGSGKTLAVWFGALGTASSGTDRGLRVLWITPMRALAADTETNLREPLHGLGIDWRVDRWTGDVSAYRKRKIRSNPGEALVTTPESLSLLLSQPDFAPRFAGLQTVIVDEWHELLGSKRGVLTALALARLRRAAPGLRVWGLSATLGNIEEAAEVLGGRTEDGTPASMEVVEGGIPKRMEIESLLPDAEAPFPWAGHLGLRLLPTVLAELREARTAIVFTNTRSQAELWHSALSTAAPDLAIGIHHGSIDRARRAEAEAEAGLRTGQLRAVVATSSLDLGVDFAPVERVIQVGSPKGVARLLQRAGRSGHQPGATRRPLRARQRLRTRGDRGGAGVGRGPRDRSALPAPAGARRALSAPSDNRSRQRFHLPRDARRGAHRPCLPDTGRADLAMGASVRGHGRRVGGRLPLSTELAAAVRDRFDRAARGIFEGAEMQRVRPLLEIQATMSVLPRKNEYLAETLRSREGWHIFLYPFAGRLAHEGLATVMAWRLTRLRPNSLVWAANDYGLEILAAKETDFAAALPALLRPENLADDILASVNGTELARRSFREIARVAGLTREGPPGRPRGARQIQASSYLLFEVFQRYEPDHRLLAQSRREVLEMQLEETRLRNTMRRMQTEACIVRQIEAPTPLAYPLFVERLREQLTSEQLADRIRAMEVVMEKAHRKHVRT